MSIIYIGKEDFDFDLDGFYVGDMSYSFIYCSDCSFVEYEAIEFSEFSFRDVYLLLYIILFCFNSCCFSFIVLSLVETVGLIWVEIDFDLSFELN